MKELCSIVEQAGQLPQASKAWDDKKIGALSDDSGERGAF
jgi:hypothetical protein